MTYTPESVVSYGFPIDDFTFTYLLNSAIVAADVGKAVNLDNAANRMKLTGNGQAILGRLYSFEDRTVSGIKTGAVQRKFKERLPAISGHGIIVGDAVCGSATPGVVRKAVAGTDPITNVVVEVIGDFVVVESL